MTSIHRGKAPRSEKIKKYYVIFMNLHKHAKYNVSKRLKAAECQFYASGIAL